jgi:hypothetical protein
MSFQPGAHLSLPSTETHPLSGRTVLQIIPELETGGAERTTVDIAKGRARRLGGRAPGRGAPGEGRALVALSRRFEKPDRHGAERAQARAALPA